MFNWGFRKAVETDIPYNLYERRDCPNRSRKCQNVVLQELSVYVN